MNKDDNNKQISGEDVENIIDTANDLIINLHKLVNRIEDAVNKIISYNGDDCQ